MTSERQRTAADLFKTYEEFEYGGVAGIRVRGLEADEVVDILSQFENPQEFIMSVASVMQGMGIPKDASPNVRRCIQLTLDKAFDRSDAAFLEAYRAAEIVPAGLQAAGMKRTWDRTFPGGIPDFLTAAGIELTEATQAAVHGAQAKVATVARKARR